MARLNHVKSFRGTSKTDDGTLRCSKCGDTIAKGDSYLWWKNRTPGSFSGFKRVRCSKTECRPMPWEYQTTSPHIAALMQADHYGSESVSKLEVGDDPEAFTQAVAEAVQGVADGVREAGEGYRESGENIESGFGHATYQSEELEEKANGLEGQADELESWEPDGTGAPDKPEDPSDDEEDDYQSELESWADGVKEEAYEAITAGCEVPY